MQSLPGHTNEPRSPASTGLPTPGLANGRHPLTAQGFLLPGLTNRAGPLVAQDFPLIMKSMSIPPRAPDGSSTTSSSAISALGGQLGSTPTRGAWTSLDESAVAAAEVAAAVEDADASGCSLLFEHTEHFRT